MRLEADGLEPLTLAVDSDGDLVVSEYELTFPDVRRVTEFRPGADGETDRSAFFGARALTLKMRVHPTGRQAIVDRLRAFCHPSKRPWFYWDEGGGERRVQLVADSQSAPISNPGGLDYAASFRCPSPFAESANATVSTILPAAATSGFSFPFSFPLTFGAGGGGAVAVFNDGNMPAQWVARIFGACTDPVLINSTTGQTVGFSGLTIAATDYLEINSTTHTVLLNGSTASSRYSKLALTTLSWWRIEPGANQILFNATAPGATAAAEITFRSCWL